MSNGYGRGSFAEEFEIRNYMEVCVAEQLLRIMRSANSCECEHCRLDVMAMALNFLPPKYVVTKRGELYTRLNILQQQFNVDIVMALTKAIEAVAKNPRH